MQLQDIIHLYPNCEVEVTDYEGIKTTFIDKIEGAVFGESVCLKKYGDWYFNGESSFTIKLCLRPLQSLTEPELTDYFTTFYPKEELEEIKWVNDQLSSPHWSLYTKERMWGCRTAHIIDQGNPYIYPAQFLWLLNHYIDVLQLIPKGLAIEKII